MKKILFLAALLLPFAAHTYPIYTSSFNSDFRPYIGIDAGLNIADYTIDTDLDDTYYSATINAGARIGNHFGVELFFTQSSTNDLEYVYDFYAINHELYYNAFGFDIYGYYNISKEFDFFTSFGIANYKIYNEFDYLDIYMESAFKEKENEVTTRLGIGILYTFPGNHVSGLIQYQYSPINTEIIKTMSEFSIGMRYIF